MGIRNQLAVLSVARAAYAASYADINSAANTARQPFSDAFLSYSIEFSSFPDYAGNDSAPNTFSDNLLVNIGDITGTKPYIRVGGNTQDYALYNASLPYALNGTWDYSRSADYPTTIYIGPSYFESYNQWSDVKFSHGFNLALGANNSAGWQALLDTVPLACKALGGGKLLTWEYGNEPNIFSTSAQGPVRPADWNATTYVSQWLNGTRQIKTSLQESCPELLSNGSYGYMAPSLVEFNHTITAPEIWEAGLNEDEVVQFFSTHNYISGAESPGVTLQGTLMNHTRTMSSVDDHMGEYDFIFSNRSSDIPIIFGEHNSLYNQGKPGLSNSFGAALWGIDFNLYSASAGIKRVHMHLGTDYRYASWQPVETANTSIGTKAPYYGNIAVAAFLGDTVTTPVSVAHLSLSSASPFEAAYAAYATASSTLLRAIVINMHGYNTTLDGSGVGVATTTNTTSTRPSRLYTFDVSGSLRAGDRVSVQRLSANGSDAVTGISWDGWSYNYELDLGRPVRLSNATTGEYVVVSANGSVTVSVPDSSAAMLTFVTTDNGTAAGNGTGGSGGNGSTTNAAAAKEGFGSASALLVVGSFLWASMLGCGLW